MVPLANGIFSGVEKFRERFDRTHWIERSGSSIDYLGALNASFPKARFLHLHRDGYETALSMRGHHAYRLPIALMYRAQDGDGPPITAIDFDAAPDPSDPRRVAGVVRRRRTKTEENELQRQLLDDAASHKEHPLPT